MKLLQHIDTDNSSSLFLYGAIMFANIDYVSVMDYVIKAVLGGAVWFGFKLLQEYYAVKIRTKAKEKFNDTNHEDGKA